MRFCRRLLTGSLLVLLTGLAAQAQAQPQVVIEHTREADAAAEFKFKNVPSPAKNDAASKAKFTLVDGLRDRHGGDLKVLNDGRVPTTADQPGRNFFYGQGQDGGRLAIDLGNVIEVKQVNTYSWHPGTRGPQVYQLYAADGSAPGFEAQPKKGTDPAKCGWNPVAAVDTRPGSGPAGGQYGVSVSGSAGALGKYRYLLFDISATEKDDPFGNTFYSEIDVIDAARPQRLEAASAPVAQAISQSPAAAPYQITIDYSDAPELKDWVEQKLQPALDKWYPVIVKDLPSENYTAPARVAIAISEDYRGVAGTVGTDIVCGLDWFQKNYNGEGVGAVIHELVHVVQQYRQTPGGTPNPGWLVEGVADYIRWFQYEPVPAGTRPQNPDQAKYTDSYRTTAGFLNFVAQNHDQEIVANLNAAMRQGKYRTALWKKYTGKTVDELWEEYVATLKK
jgi:hypothetical protein